MSEFYMPVIKQYCDIATEYSGLIKEIDKLKEQLVYCELRAYYQKYIKEDCPF